jgi:hypothetical protein
MNRRGDWYRGCPVLADEAVPSEPLSTSNFLLTGKIIGKFIDSGLLPRCPRTIVPTLADIVDKLNKEIIVGLADPKLKARVVRHSWAHPPNSASSLSKTLRSGPR